MLFRKKPAVRLQQIDNYFACQLSWCRFLGLALPETKTHRWLFTVYKAFILLVLIKISLFFGITVYLDILSGSFEAVAYSLPQFMVFLISTFYLAYFQFNTQYYFDLMSYMNANFQFRSSRGLTYVTSQWTFDTCNLMTKIWHIAALSSTGVVSILPVFQDHRVLPLRCWYPFDMTNGPVYQLLYFSQVLVQLIMPLSFCAAITLPLSTALLLSGQYDLLCCGLKNLQWTAVRNSAPSPENVYRMRVLQLKMLHREQFDFSTEYLDDIGYDEKARKVPRKYVQPRETYNTERQDQLHEALCDCIRFHQILNECCNRLEAINNPLALIKVLEISFQMCLLAITILRSSGSLISYATNVMYLAMTVLDLFCLCHLGQIIESQSSRVGDFLYDTPWEGFSAPVRRTILIMQLYTVNPKKMTGGMFFALSYEKFVATVKLSFSYFTLIESMGE